MVDQANRLKTRDLITIGVFNALILVFYIILQAILQPIPGMGLVNGGLAAFLMAPLFLLMASRVQKVGVFFLTSLLYAIFIGLVGIYWGIIPVLLGGILADIVANLRKYRGYALLVAAYAIYETLQAVGNYSVIVINPQRYAANMTGVAREKFLQSVQLFTFWVGAGVIVLTIVGSILGGLVAARMLKKHFAKAGLIEIADPVPQPTS